MSKEVSLDFDVNVSESTSVIKSQLQGIFEEINKQPHSIKVAIDGNSYNEAVNKIQEIRRLTTSVSALKMPEIVRSDVSSEIQGLGGQASDVVSTITELKTAFDKFVQNGDSGSLSFVSGVIHIKNAIDSLGNSIKEIAKDTHSMFTDADGQVINYGERLKSISELLESISEKTKLLEDINSRYVGSTSQPQSNSEEIKKTAKSEKELELAVEDETEAEEKRKISLSQFLTLYERLLKLQNQNTHMFGDGSNPQYNALTSSINGMSDTYDKVKNSVTEIDNLLEMTGVDAKKLADSFDKGTIAAKQFTAALPNSSDGVKVESALKAINQSNRLLGKYESLGVNLKDEDNVAESYGRLLTLTGDLERKIDRAAGAFKNLGTETKNTGGKISDIMRQMSIESENLKSEISKIEISNKANKVASDEEQLTESVKKESNAEKERIVSLREFLSLYETLTKLANQNTIMSDVPQYKNVIDVIGVLEESYKVLKEQETDLDDVSKVLGKDIYEAFNKGKVAADQLKAAIPNQSDGVKYESVVAKITSLNNLMKNNRGMELSNPDRWNALSDAVSSLEELIDRDKNQFKLLGDTASESVTRISEKLRIAISEGENFKNAIPVTTEEVDAFNLVANQIDKIGKVLRTNSNLKGNKAYDDLKNSMVELNGYLDRTSGKLKEVANESEGDGTKISSAMDKSALALLNFNYELNNTEKEAKKTAIDLEKMIAQMNSWKRSLVSASKLGITSENLDYDELTKILALFDEVRASIKDNPELSLVQAFNLKEMSQSDVINKIMQANIASKDLNRTVINLKNNEISLNSTEKERQDIITKTYHLLGTMSAALKNWDKAKTGKTSDSYAQIKEGATALSSYINQLKNGRIDVEKFNAEIAKIRYSFEANSAVIKNAGENVKSFGSNLKKVASSFSMWFSLTSIVMRAYNSIKQMISVSMELDDAMTQLKIVTDKTDDTYKKFGATLADVAKRTATSISDITKSATTYARLGYSLEEASKIAEYTAKLQNVGDIGVENAQNAITAILKAYDGIDADSIEDVMNKLVVTGNNFPISVSQIAEGMNNASSALSAAGNTFEQSVALLTAANTTIQDAAKSSTAMRTIAARLRKTDSELEALGESMTSSKYDALVKSLANLNIGLVDVNGEYRATYDIISDIASKWDSMSSMEQAALADLAAGTRQQSAFYSLIEQFKEASGAMDAMSESADALNNAYSVYLDSATAHVNQFKASMQELSSDTFNSGLISTIVDVSRTFVEFTDAIVKARLGIVALAAAIGVAAFANWKKNMIAESVAVQSISTKLVMQKGITDQLSVSLVALNKKQLESVRAKTYAAYASEKLSYEEFKEISANLDLLISEKTLEQENYALSGSFEAVTASIPVWGWFIIGLTAVVSVMGFAINKAEEMKEAFHENTEKIRDNIKSLEDFKKKVDDIYNSDSTDKLKEYNELRQDIIDSYDTHIDKITDEAEAVDILNKKLDEEIARKRDLYLLDTEEQYNMVKKYSSDFGKDEGNFWSDIWRKLTTDPGKSQDWRDINITNPTSTTSKEAAQISDNILKLFDSGSTNLWDKATFSIGKKAKNEVELLKIIEDAYLKFGDIKDARESVGGSLTEGEELLFESLKDQYNGLKEHLGESGIDYESALERASVMVDKLVSKFPQGTKSLEEWEASLIKNANGDELVIDKIKEMIAALRELNQEVKVDSLDELTEILETFKGQLEQVNETISTASDYFDDLAKVIDKNKEIDKFFTADEMIDMLDKYPELNDNVLVTAYGYKFEAEALEELRKAKLEEQKTDIETKLKEIKASKDKAEAKFIEYQSELRGISTVAEAEAELALVEQQLNDSTFKQGGYIANQLEEKRAKLAGYIEVSKNIRKLSQEYDKSVMQYTLLGNVFDDLKDSTNDATKALNNQKAALKDLADEYKDAKDAIEDLIKLTMDMIKKEKNLEKEALKEQLEGFKKLIDKRKELIDLEKDQYDFEKDLKEQNKDLLKIQQELDALSVEGVNYSLEDLKRKAELQEQLAEQQSKRDEFLYDHEVDVRKKALDDEEKSFEEKINTQIKAIEDYLDHEGKIRADAVELINGQTQEFYDRLLGYTMNYTSKSRFEFDKLWNDAYDALRKYGNGVIDVDATLAFLIGKIAAIDDQMEALENQINNTKNAATQFIDGFKDGLEGVGKVIAEDIEAVNELGNSAATAISKASTAANAATGYTVASAGAHSYWHTPTQSEIMNSSTAFNTKRTDSASVIASNLSKAKAGIIDLKDIFKFHDGGLVPHQGIRKNSEVFAKLLAGEVVVTQDQASAFMNSTLPKLANANVTNNNAAPIITIGDINIAGNADSNTVSQLKEVQKQIVDDVFKTINSRNSMYNGGRIK